MEHYRDICVYDLSSYFIITATNKQRSLFKILKIRKQTNSLEINDDLPGLSPRDYEMYIHRVIPEQRSTPIATGHAILGLIRFLQGFYLFLVTKKQKVGELREKSIYKVIDTKLVNLFSDRLSKHEERYRDIFKNVDVAQGFYFSYTYDLTHTLQQNIAAAHSTPKRHRTRKSITNVEDIQRSATNSLDRQPYYPWKSTYVWNNAHLFTMLSVLKDRHWVTPIIHGYIGYQRLGIFGRVYDFLLISRRSRFFAGTRYLKRGLNEQGKVANDVETEQILIDKKRFGRMSSFVQIRGSIPLFWCQDQNQLIRRPAIIINQNDFLREGTRSHIADLYSRYGTPLILLNLLKTDTSNREHSLSNDYKSSIDFINEKMPPEFHISYSNFDIKKATKVSIDHCKQCLYSFGNEKIRKTGVFSLRNQKNKTFVEYQTGVIRTNCIDCIDRTNAAQMLVGYKALELQMQKMGLVTQLEKDSNIYDVLSGLYEEMGDIIGIQYSGSEAHRQFNKESTHKANYLYTSIKRHWSNVVTDSKKQQAINLFLGVFVPSANNVNLWEIEDDNRLHNSRRLGYEMTPEWWMVDSSKFSGRLGIAQYNNEHTDGAKLKRSKSTFFTKQLENIFAVTYERVLPLLTESHSTKLFSLNRHFAKGAADVTQLVFSQEEVNLANEMNFKQDDVLREFQNVFDPVLGPQDIQMIEDYLKVEPLQQTNYVQNGMGSAQEEDYEQYVSQAVEEKEIDFTPYFNLNYDEKLHAAMSMEDLIFLNNY